MTINTDILANLLLGGLLTALWWFFRERIRTIEASVRETSAKMNEVQGNYLDRFDDLRSLITSEHEELKDRIGNLREDLARNYMQKADCAAILGSGKHDNA